MQLLCSRGAVRIAYIYAFGCGPGRQLWSGHVRSGVVEGVAADLVKFSQISVRNGTSTVWVSPKPCELRGLIWEEAIHYWRGLSLPLLKQHVHLEGGSQRQREIGRERQRDRQTGRWWSNCTEVVVGGVEKRAVFLQGLTGNPAWLTRQHVVKGGGPLRTGLIYPGRSDRRASRRGPYSSGGIK